MIREVFRFDSARREDFFRLHANEQLDLGCYCAFWWISREEYKQNTAEDNRQVREVLLERGEYDGYLLYVDGEAAGWCQVGRRDRLQKLVDQFRLEPDPETWAITCFVIHPQYHRQGMATYLLGEVLADLELREVRRVEAFPKRGPDLDIYDLWNGPEEMFHKAGFQVVRDDPKRPILAKILD